MKRDSLVGPIILIAIGCFFLMRKWVDIPSLREIITDWWPLILIGIGISQLLQRSSGQNRT